MKMSSALSALMLSVIAFGLSACGDLKPLTAEQKAILREVNESVAATRVSSRPSNPQSSRTGAVSSFEEREESESGQSPQDAGVRFQEALARAMADGRCRTETDSRVRGRSSAQSGFKLSGASCPIFLELSVDASATQGDVSSGSGRFKGEFKYRVLDEELRALNDVDQFNVVIETEVRSNGGKRTGGGSIQGSIHSQKHGDVRFKFELRGEANREGQGKLQVTVRYEFNDFIAEGRAEMDQDQNAKYSVNGEEVSQDEFNELVARGMTGLNAGQSM